MLPDPTSDLAVDNAEDNTPVILWRGISHEDCTKMINAGSLGGVKADSNARRPTDTEAENQVASFSKPGFQRKDKLPEFTCSKAVANGYGRGQLIVAVKVLKKYLTRGSGRGEEGWVAAWNAPFQAIWYENGPEFVGGFKPWKVNAD